MMPHEQFTAALAAAAPPADYRPALAALWHEAKGDWQAAHDLLQDGDPACDRVHAYLHRREGDDANAQYWYRRAGVRPSSLTLDDERATLVAELLAV